MEPLRTLQYESNSAFVIFQFVTCLSYLAVTVKHFSSAVHGSGSEKGTYTTKVEGKGSEICQSNSRETNGII